MLRTLNLHDALHISVKLGGNTQWDRLLQSLGNKKVNLSFLQKSCCIRSYACFCVNVLTRMINVCFLGIFVL